MSPRVSVVVPAYLSHESVAATLDALREQDRAAFEVIVVDSSPDERTADVVRRGFPEVRLIRSRERLLPHGARNRGVRDAHGEIVAFTDPDCVPRRDWLTRLVAAHDAGREIVGGAIASRGSGPVDAAVHLTKFAAWLPAGHGEPRDFASANLSLTRARFDALGGFDDAIWTGDSELVWRARAAGARIGFDRAAIVEHDHDADLRGFLRERRDRGRDFALTRATHERWGARRCAARVLAAPLVAPVLTARALRANPGFLSPAAIPLALAGFAAWSAGEARGLLDRLYAPASSP